MGYWSFKTCPLLTPQCPNTHFPLPPKLVLQINYTTSPRPPLSVACGKWQNPLTLSVGQYSQLSSSQLKFSAR